MTAPETMTMNCPNEETLAAFVDGRLSSPDRQRVLVHMSNCAECRSTVLMATEAAATVGTRSGELPAVPSLVSRPTFRIVATLAAAALLVIVFGPGIRDRFLSSRKPITAMVKASEDLKHRSTTARLTGGFPYRPLPPIFRGGRDEKLARLSMLSAAGGIENRASRNPSVENLHALGVSQLVVGYRDDALVTLRRAVFAETNENELPRAIHTSTNAALLNDLAAVLLETGREPKTAEDRLLAHEAVDRAWKLEQSPEIAWNRALAYEALQQKNAAVDAWRTYLKLDPGSPWAAEVRKRLEGLETPTHSERWPDAQRAIIAAAETHNGSTLGRLVAEYPQQSRMWAEDDLLPCWAKESRRGDVSRAQDCLATAAIVGDVLAERKGECLLRDSVKAIRASRLDLSAAHLAHAEGRAAYREGRISHAKVAFENAIALFNRTHSPFVTLTRVYLASTNYYENDYAKSLAEVRSLLADFPDRERYRAAYAQAMWVSGIDSAWLGDLATAVEAYRKALSIFEAGGEEDNVLAMRENLASTLEMIGDRNGSWAARFEALEQLNGLGNTALRLPQTITGAARAAYAHGYPATARLLTEREIEVTNFKRGSHDQLRAAQAAAYTRRAVLRHEDGDSSGAAHDLDQAAKIAQTIEDSFSREFALTDPDFVRARLATARQETRLSLVEHALNIAKHNGNRYRTVELLLLLGREHAQQGQADVAIGALREATQLIERQDDALRDPVWREALLDERRGAVRDLVALLIRNGRVASSLVEAERSRARTFRGSLLEPFRLDDERDLVAAQRLIPRDVVVVYYASLADRLVIWLVTSTRVELFETSAGLHDLRTVGRTAITGDDVQFDAAITKLSTWLIDPWIRSTARATTIVFIPDEVTADVPFAALRNGQAMLIERHRVMIAPSLATYLGAIERDRMFGTAAAPVLVVAALSRRDDYGLAPLDGGRLEIDALRGAFPNATVIEGSSATKRNVIDAMKSAAVIHITAHAMANDREPSYSALVLEPEGGDQGFFYAHEIARLRLPSTRLVVIATCDAFKAGRFAREGVGNIGRAFMAAGVPVVIGNTRELNDTIAAEIVTSFYRRIGAGADPASALRDTQLSMHGKVAPVDWATLQVMGGVAERSHPNGT